MLSTAVRTATAVVALVVAAASSAAAQTNPTSNGGLITLSGAFDTTTAYLFRGLLQDDTGFIMFPSADVGIRLFSDASPTVLHVGTWNSLTTGLAGSDGPTHRLWYENRFYTTLNYSLTEDYGVGATYTAYTSPNGSFSAVKEIAFKVGTLEDEADSNAYLSPYALIAFELDTEPGLGQADGGREGGTYLELGAAPRWDRAPVNVYFPIRVGLSLHDYYELAGVDHPFGFLSLGAHAEVPLTRTRNYGTWNVHGGIDFYSLGDTPEAFNGGDQIKLVAFVGIGFTY